MPTTRACCCCPSTPFLPWLMVGVLYFRLHSTTQFLRPYGQQHYTVRELYIFSNRVEKGFNQMARPALDMSRAFDTINILIRELQPTRISGTIIKLIANYIKGQKAYTTYINHTSIQRQFKTGVPQCGVLSPTLLTFTADLHTQRASVQDRYYADDITITSTLTITSSVKKCIQQYLHKVFA